MIWMYNKDGPRLFESKEDVPKRGGWKDSPAKVKQEDNKPLDDAQNEDPQNDDGA